MLLLLKMENYLLNILLMPIVQKDFFMALKKMEEIILMMTAL